MSAKDIEQITNRMEPEEAAIVLVSVIKKVLPLLDENDRLKFVMDLVGESGEDKVASMVHLWLAECMDEGVDPTQMCQSLVEKVAQSKQLSAVVDPEVLVLFENWLEELESELISFVQKTGSLDPVDLAEGLGLSRSGANFFLTKLKREGRL